MTMFLLVLVVAITLAFIIALNESDTLFRAVKAWCVEDHPAISQALSLGGWCQRWLKVVGGNAICSIYNYVVQLAI